MRILVVDDEPSVKDVLVTALEKEGHHVESAAAAIDALSRVRSQDFDVMIVDVRMPALSGLALHRMIAEIDPALARRTIVTSGCQTAEIDAHVAEIGRFLSKPFTLNELHRAIRAASRA